MFLLSSVCLGNNFFHRYWFSTPGGNCTCPMKATMAFEWSGTLFKIRRTALMKTFLWTYAWPLQLELHAGAQQRISEWGEDCAMSSLTLTRVAHSGFVTFPHTSKNRGTGYVHETQVGLHVACLPAPCPIPSSDPDPPRAAPTVNIDVHGMTWVRNEHST